MLCTPARFAAAISVVMMPCFSAVETPEVGSSSRMTRGSSANAEATSSNFFSPCDKVAAGLASRCCRPKISATCATRAPTAWSDARGANSRHRFPCRETTAAAMVSATVSCGKIWISWNERTRPRSASRTGPIPAMLSPMNSTSPAVGVRSPVSRLTRVVLPAPFGPTTETSSCAFMAILTSLKARNSPKYLLTVLVSRSAVMATSALAASADRRRGRQVRQEIR